MIIKNARFVTSMSRLGPYAGQGKPEIAMTGRSNVGKSSLINRICHNSHLAKTSSEPGKTRLINIYNVNDSFFLTDLPGYGFAKASGKERQTWAGMIEGYLAGSKELRHVLQLIDLRHEPTDDDKMMVDWLRHYEIPFTVVATKADKLSRAAQGRMIPAICRKLIVQPWEVIPFSAEDGTGAERILELLGSITGTD